MLRIISDSWGTLKTSAPKGEPTKKRKKKTVKTKAEIIKIAEAIEARIESTEAQLAEIKAKNFKSSLIREQQEHLTRLQSQLEGIKLCFA